MTEVPAPGTAAWFLPAPDRRGHDRTRSRDQDGFEALYTGEMRAVTVFLMNLGASVYEAADAAHEAFLTLLPDKWRELEHPRAWLRTVAYRTYLRQATRLTHPLDSVPDRPGGTCPVDLVLLTEEQTTVLRALGRLSPAEREAMAWKLDGFTHEETARVLGKSPEAVRQAYVRARKRLITLLGLKREAESGE
ncbi:RNA polymerase sigma-70 factor (ECF subfamily) [Streptomyces sp. PanSC19]|uniref:RNA polymerase sigma factor n=1 Tax=Streptomyces litmocidini TaxID=67318 RepID=A0ABW7UK30_9ACTN|nr:RNA polymerase sigma-70 factor (ECF subfamily) [Streptomyces sp. PanSC19]